MAIYKVISKPQKLQAYRDENAYRDVIHYCLSKEQVTTDCIFGIHINNPEHAASEMEAVAKLYGKTGKRLRHSVLTLSEPHITLQMAAEIAQEVLKFYYDRYQMIAVIHTDTKHLHIHFVMNQISFQDGSRYMGNKKDFYRFKSHLTQVLRPYKVGPPIMTSGYLDAEN